MMLCFCVCGEACTFCTDVESSSFNFAQKHTIHDHKAEQTEQENPCEYFES